MLARRIADMPVAIGTTVEMEKQVIAVVDCQPRPTLVAKILRKNGALSDMSEEASRTSRIDTRIIAMDKNL